MHVTDSEAAALFEIGNFLGGLFRTGLAARVESGHLDHRHQAEDRAARKRDLTAVSSSRWAGAITRAVEDQYQTGIRGLVAHLRSLDEAIGMLEKRCALSPGERDGKVAGYRTGAERFEKTRRLAVLRGRAEETKRRLEDGRPSMVVGGKRLWRNRNNLDAAGLTESEWRERWDTARMFLTADGETGKAGGNETIRVSPATRQLRIKVPAALVDRFGTHLIIGTPVSFSHRREQWQERIRASRAVRYDMVYDPERGRWYLDASWRVEPEPQLPLAVLRAGRVLGVDMNAGHLAICVVDSSGNPVDEPCTINLVVQGFPATTRDGRLRAAVTQLLDRAEAAGCAAVVIENLDFADARSSGRETMGRGVRGRRFRRTVAGMPTAKFRDRLRGMAARRNLALIAVDPAHTSKTGGKHWRKPLQHRTSDRDVTVHDGAAVAIGRRALGYKLSRHPAGPCARQRTSTGMPRGSAAALNRVRATSGGPRPTTGPYEEAGAVRRAAPHVSDQDRSGRIERTYYRLLTG
ncbi:hypothetical protein [Nocardia sp. NPDC020380]|uniref:hypothetical protein n=1 Tax=Nocardia sp. NPDC020380 TaxID=3364309 RepID=UPI00379F4A4E